jgi:hypothetical protein
MQFLGLAWASVASNWFARFDLKNNEVGDEIPAPNSKYEPACTISDDDSPFSI